MAFNFNSEFAEPEFGFPALDENPAPPAFPVIPAAPAPAPAYCNPRDLVLRPDQPGQQGTLLYQGVAALPEQQIRPLGAQLQLRLPQPQPQQQQQTGPLGAPVPQPQLRLPQPQQQPQQQRQGPGHLHPPNWASWPGYLQRQNLLGVWPRAVAEKAEKHNYGLITARLAAGRDAGFRDEAAIVEERGYWHTRPGRPVHDQPRRVMNVIRAVDAAARRVEEAWATRKSRDGRHEALVVDDKSGRCPGLHKLVGHMGSPEQTGQYYNILVTRSLQNSRYYLGHGGGDYIFRYLGQPLTGNHDVLLGWEDQEAFQYCGQVPRPQAEYLCRLEALAPQVVRILASVIGFHNRAGKGQLPCAISRICRKDSPLTSPDLARLAIVWNKMFPAGKDPVGLMHEVANNPVVEEFAWLLAVLIKDRRRLLTAQLSPLVYCLERATQRNLLKIAEGRYKRLKYFAYLQLFSGKDEGSLLVFQDDSIQNVHEFYRQPRFHDDPLHPSFRSKPVDVSAALALSRQHRNPGWETDEEDPEPPAAQQPESESELSDAPSDIDLEDAPPLEQDSSSEDTIFALLQSYSSSTLSEESREPSTNA
ncbi:hypothetical protein AK830_g12064 [Neonectria ditissima]|uniref:Uncharacterized protein n=1 Tax=Neonectria ditissima TaxID=78410 RepID=A0A0P7AKS8_9HYPO|nr:hypothetical protein AK830_g12064 [Neonectria ditissima]